MSAIFASTPPKSHLPSSPYDAFNSPSTTPTHSSSHRRPTLPASLAPIRSTGPSSQQQHTHQRPLWLPSPQGTRRRVLTRQQRAAGGLQADPLPLPSPRRVWARSIPSPFPSFTRPLLLPFPHGSRLIPSGGPSFKEESYIHVQLDDDVAMTYNSPKKPLSFGSPALSSSTASSATRSTFGCAEEQDATLGANMRESMVMSESSPNRGGDVETLDDDEASLHAGRGARSGGRGGGGGWSPSPLRHQRESTAPALPHMGSSFLFEESPIKRGQMSESRSLGRALGKRPNSLFDPNISHGRHGSSSRSLLDGGLFAGVALDESEEGGSMRGPASDSDDDDDDDPRPSLKPLSFPIISPSPFLATGTPSGAGFSGGNRQRALTEHDLNASVSPGNASLSSASCNAIPTTTSSVFLSPLTPLAPRSARFDALKASKATNTFLSASISASLTHTSSNSHLLSSKKAVSLDNLHLRENSAPNTSSFATLSKPAGMATRTRRSSLLSGVNASGKSHKRVNSNEQSPFNLGASTSGQSLSRSNGLKSGLSQAPASLSSSSSTSSTSSALAGGLPPSSSQHHIPTSTSLTHLSTTFSHPDSVHNQNLEVRADPALNRSAPASLSNYPPGAALPFNDAKPLLAAFQAKSSLARKFKPRDSGVALDGPDVDSPRRALHTSTSSSIGCSLPLLAKKANSLPHLNITSSFDAPPNASDVELATPSFTGSPGHSWPSTSAAGASLNSSIGHGAFDFLGGEAAEALANAVAGQHTSGTKVMPDTPVKRSAFNLAGSIGKAGASGLSNSLGMSTQPHPLSLSMQAAGPDSSSPLNSAAPSPYRAHHSTSILARSHRPSSNKPPHLQIPHAAGSRIPVATASPRIPAVSSAVASGPSGSPLFHVKLNGSSPDSTRGASSPVPEADSPTVLRKGIKALHASTNAGNSPYSPVVGPNGKPGASRTSLLRRTSSGVGSLSGSSSSESEGGGTSRYQSTPTRGGLSKSQLYSPYFLFIFHHMSRALYRDRLTDLLCSLLLL